MKNDQHDIMRSHTPNANINQTETDKEHFSS